MLLRNLFPITFIKNRYAICLNNILCIFFKSFSFPVNIYQSKIHFLNPGTTPNMLCFWDKSISPFKQTHKIQGRKKHRLIKIYIKLLIKLSLYKSKFITTFLNSTEPYWFQNNCSIWKKNLLIIKYNYYTSTQYIYFISILFFHVIIHHSYNLQNERNIYLLTNYNENCIQ